MWGDFVPTKHPSLCRSSHCWLIQFQKKKKRFERAMLFFLVSPIRNRFFFESIWKKIFPKSFINNMQYYFVACFIRNLISRKEEELFLLFTILCTNIYIYKSLEPVFLLTEINNLKKGISN